MRTTMWTRWLYFALAMNLHAAAQSQQFMPYKPTPTSPDILSTPTKFEGHWLWEPLNKPDKDTRGAPNWLIELEADPGLSDPSLLFTFQHLVNPHAGETTAPVVNINARRYVPGKARAGVNRVIHPAQGHTDLYYWALDTRPDLGRPLSKPADITVEAEHFETSPLPQWSFHKSNLVKPVAGTLVVSGIYKSGTYEIQQNTLSASEDTASG